MTLAPIVLPPAIAVERERDATSTAVLRYFEGAETQADAFDHLVAICYEAVRPFFLRERDGIGTREWIQVWLVDFLASYRGKTRAELIAAADGGEFRYIGRLCRLRLLDAIKSATARKNAVPVHVSLSNPVARDEDGRKQTLLDCIGTMRQDAPSSLANGSSFEEVLECVSNAFRAVMANSEELARLDVLDGLRAILANAEHLEDSSPKFRSRVVRSIAKRRGITERAARSYLRKFDRTIASQMKASNPALRAVQLELSPEPPIYDAQPGSAKTQTHEAPPISQAELSALAESALRTKGCAWDDQK